VPYKYHSHVLEQLWHHGIQPTPATPPQLVHDFVNDLYRYELRRLRDRLLRGEIVKAGYHDRVVEIRMRYRLLAMRAWQWVEQGHPGVSPDASL
jgi:hypothetical protein